MSPVTIYLAGAITDQTIAGANDWRDYMIRQLAPYGIRGISPLRCEPPRGERYTIANSDPLFGTSRAIRSKNFFDVRACTWTLAYMPTEFNSPWPSVGTIGELALAHGAGKTTILVSTDRRLVEHPVVRGISGWILPTLDDAVEVIGGVLKAYVPYGASWQTKEGA